VRKYLAYAILFLAFLLRIVSLDRFPSGFTPDEASFGYDAYSILKTGKDQWGVGFPIVFKSFGDYKSPLYAYLDIPFVAVGGLNKVAVRLPNAIVGTLAVFAVYLLVEALFKKKNLSLIVAFLVAVSSWHILMSRGAFEANLTTFFLPFGIYLYLKKRYNLSALFLGLNLFTYHSAKLITPIIFVALILVTKKFKLIPSLIFSFLFALTIYSFTLGGGARIAERSITQGALEEGAKIKIGLIQKGANPTLARLFHNKYQVTIFRFINNYKQYFSYEFLFEKGPRETTYGMIPGQGVLYGFEGILLLGLLPLIYFKKVTNTILLLFCWLLISPIPAAFSTGVGFSANRAEVMVPVIQILEVVGITGWLIILNKIKGNLRLIPVGAFVILVVFEIVSFAKLYFVDSPKIVSKGMLYGNLEAAQWLTQNYIGKDIVVSRTISEPQIYIAFAGKLNPTDYQNATKSWKLETWVDQIPSYKLGNFIFQNEKINVGRPEDFKENIVPSKVFYYPDGKAAIYAKLN
jgi:4-amino-4-deoxy-L-arabinose transferase-like glycosyltransferase